MRRLPVALAFAFAAAAMATLWSLRRGDPAPLAAGPPDAPSPRRTMERATVDAAPATTIARTPTAVDRSSAGEPAANADAPPVPDGAQWVDLTVLDAATRAPVDDAEVHWAGMQQTARAGALPAPEARRLLADPEAVARRFGWHTRTDARGRARVHLFDWTHVLARKGDRFAFGRFVAGSQVPPEGLSLLLEPDRTLTVQARDSFDRPAAELALELAPGMDRGPFQEWGLPATVTTDADGIATFAHMQLRKRANDAATAAAPWHLRALLSGGDDLGMTIDFGALPSSPVVLRLPPCGSLLVDVEAQGHRLEAGRVELRRAGTDYGSEPNWVAAIETDGFAHFAYVPVGASLAASAVVDRDRAVGEIVAPSNAGQQAQSTLRLPASSCVLVGRALDDGHRPVAGGARVFVRFSGSMGTVVGNAFPDPQGKFRFAVGSFATPVSVDNAVLFLHQQGHSPIRCMLPVLSLRAGDVDLGDLVFAAAPIVVAGRIDVAGKRTPDDNFFLRVRHLVGDATTGKAEWQPVSDLIEERDGDDFLFRGVTDTAPHSVLLTGPDLLPTDAVAFAPGQLGVVVAARRGHALRARIRLPANTTFGNVHAHLWQRPPSSPTDQPLHTASASAEHSFVDFHGLAAGTYWLTVDCTGSPSPLVTIGEIAVPQPDPGDPRLDIDLTARVQPIELRLVAADQSAVRERGAVFVMPQSGDPWRGTAASPHGTWIVTLAGPQELLVAIPGFRPQTLRNVDGDRTATLRRWPTQEIAVQAPPLPAGVSLRLRAVPTSAPASTAFRTDNGGGRLADLISPAAIWTAVEGDRADVPVDDGEHRIEVELDGDAAAGLRIERIAPASFVPSPAPLELRIEIGAAATK